MAYYEKYYFTFIGIDNAEYRCEIHENEFVGQSKEIRGYEKPFIVNYPQFNLFEPIRGSGCQITLLAEKDREFIGLFTPDMFKYQIKLLKDGITCWWGYLDSELYSEPFDSIDNYPVSFTGTDGLALLDRINYLDDNGNHYTGITTQWDVIVNILGKLSIGWNAVFVMNSTTSPQLTIASGETIFHKTYVRNENWYNEDDEPETCRKVLEEILRPYGAFLIISDNVLYISDINTVLVTGTTNYSRYDITDGHFVGDFALQMNLGDLSNIGFANTSQNLSIISGINKQIISYSPYRLTTALNYDATNDFYGVHSTTQYGDINYRWTETLYDDSYSWYKTYYGYFAKATVDEGEDIGKEESYLKFQTWPAYFPYIDDAFKTFQYVKPLPYFLPSNNYKIRLTMKVMVITNNNIYGGDMENNEVMAVKIWSQLSIGGKTIDYRSFDESTSTVLEKPSLTTVEWTDDFTKGLQIDISDYQGDGEYSGIENQWQEYEVYTLYTPFLGEEVATKIPADFPISEYMSYPPEDGFITLTFYQWNAFSLADGSVIPHTDLIALRIKDIKISIVDSNGNDVKNEDVEYMGKLNQLYKNAGSQVTLLCGTNNENYPIEKGGLIKYVGTGTTTYENLTGWTRASSTDRVENLLLRSIISNYESPSIQLTSTINRINNILGHITYNNYLSQYFMITSCEHDYAEATSDIVIQQIKEDNLNIIINY